MKNFLRMGLALAALLLGLQGASAQVTIPNADFETWAQRSGAEAPTNWQTSDDYLAALLDAAGFPVYLNINAVQKSTTAHTGTYAASLVTQDVTDIGQSFPGILIAGSRLTSLRVGGVATAARPTTLEFYYTLSGPADDSAAAVAYITKTTSAGTQVLGRVISYLQPTTGSTYVKATLPITYASATSNVTPDSARVLFYSGTADNITVGTTLQIDDVALTNGTLTTRADLDVQAQVSVSPNPSPGGRFVISSAAQPVLAAAPLRVLDQLGREVARQPAQPAPAGQRELDLSALSPGLYLLRLDTQQGVITRQLSVK